MQQQQLGEANTALCAKEEECGKLAEERDRLVTQLAEQKELLKKAQEEAEARRLEEEAAREWAEMPREAQIRRALQVAQLVLRSRISVGELEDLSRLMESGALEPRQVVEELKEALAQDRLEGWLERFRKMLPG